MTHVGEVAEIQFGWIDEHFLVQCWFILVQFVGFNFGEFLVQLGSVWVPLWLSVGSVWFNVGVFSLVQFRFGCQSFA